MSHPGGLSGSGFWGLNRKTKSYELCGIGTDYRPKAHPTHLVAVRFKLLVFFIHQRLKSNVDKYDWFTEARLSVESTLFPNTNWNKHLTVCFKIWWTS